MQNFGRAAMPKSKDQLTLRWFTGALIKALPDVHRSARVLL